MPADRVVLSIPAKGEYARTVRMTAAELAARLGMSFDDVDDVRIAAEEAFVYAAERSKHEGSVSFAFDLLPGALQVTVGPVPSACEPDGEEDPRSQYATFILESVCDEFAIEESADECTIRLTKQLS